MVEGRTPGEDAVPVVDRTRTWSAIWTGAKRRTGPARRHESAPGEAAPERRSERPANAPECRVRAPASESRGATRSRRSGRPGSTRRQRVARPGGSSREVVVAPLPRRREALERSRPQGHRHLTPVVAALYLHSRARPCASRRSRRPKAAKDAISAAKPDSSPSNSTKAGGPRAVCDAHRRSSPQSRRGAVRRC
jgi:hypothetical protein